jgi:SAM-dependent methyltransferase
MKTRFYGIFPLINMTVSYGIFFVIRFRIGSLKVFNRLQRCANRGLQQYTRIGSPKEDLARYYSEGFKKLNLGGGTRNLEGFLNIDFVLHPEVEREIIADIRNLDFVSSDSMIHIHSNHVIEHLPEDTLPDHFANCYRILMAGGLLTIRCPNALGVSYGFFFGFVPEERRTQFLEAGYPADELFNNPKDDWYVGDFFAFLHWIYGDAGNPENQHLSILTPTKLKNLIIEAGFEIVQTSDPEWSNIIIIAKKAGRLT